jgi:hypothetical protein
MRGWYEALGPVVQTYGAYATGIYFPYPASPVADSAPQVPATREQPGVLVTTFNHPALARDTGSAAQTPVWNQIRYR